MNLWEPWTKPALLRSTLDEMVMAGEVILALIVGLGIVYVGFCIQDTIKGWRKRWRKRKSG